MDIKEHTTPEKLEYYAFMWSMLRMVIAAISLFFGAMPIYFRLAGYSSSMPLLTIAWIISGVSALYLGYLWLQSGKKVLGGEQRITIFFLIMVVTGLNLGWTGIANNNIGMNLVGYGSMTADLIFKATAIVYLFVAYSLWNTWKANGEKLFGTSAPATVSPAPESGQQSEATPVPERKPDSSSDKTDSDEE